MEAISVKNLSFRYPEAQSDTLKNISFSINQGELITLCGVSGSGKTTLLRHLKPVLAPHGNTAGNISFFGADINTLSQRDQSAKIGYVMQSPDNQIVTDKVWHELAFGLESLGCDSGAIRRRVAETADFFGISRYFEADVKSLSGGQKQLLNLASVMTMQPELLILDEPVSQLDPIAAADFLSCVLRVNRELGTTVIITEHRLEDILPVSDKVIVLEDGKLISCDTPVNTGVNLKNENSRFFPSLPAPMRIWHALENEKTSCPVTVTQGREWLKSYFEAHDKHELYPEPEYRHGEAAVSLKHIYFRYQKDSPDVLKDLSFTAHRGELISIMGGNGAGKTTLLSVIGGTEKPYGGRAELSGKCLTLPQNPQAILGGKTVGICLEEALEDQQNRESRLQNVIELTMLSPLLNRHPFDLSGGEMQRVAFAKLLLLRPEILLLDEPTKGLDTDSKRRIAEILRSLAASGVCVVMVSHDIEFCAQYSHRCMLMFNGELITSDTPRRFFSSNSFYVTAANRISRGIIEDAVTVEDVVFCCTRKKNRPKPPLRSDWIDHSDNLSNNSVKENKHNKKAPLWKRITALTGVVLLIIGTLINTGIMPAPKPVSDSFWLKLLLIAVPIVSLAVSFCTFTKRSNDSFKQQGRLPRRTVASAVMILLTIPLTIFVGTVYLNDQKFLFISLLVLLECMLPFFLVFEGRKLQARELVLVAVLCAIAVAGRSAFFMLPQIKPVIALVIISGIAFGGETGFTVGAVTMLVSNIYFGQGAWTPWQMFAAGMIGFISGVIFQKGFLAVNRAVLCVYGFAVTIIIYGGIMNFSSLVLTRAPINAATLTAFYAQGLPMDIIHALSTMIILWLAAEPMLNKLTRVKTKYGLYYTNT